MAAADSGNAEGRRITWLTPDRLEVLIAVGLGVAAVLAALTVYLVKTADDKAEVAINHGIGLVAEETGAALTASSDQSADEALFFDYETDLADPATRDAARLLLTQATDPNLEKVIEWWKRHRDDPHAPRTPFSEDNPYFHSADAARADQLDREAEASFDEAHHYLEKGANFTLAGVILAVGLFMYGVAGVGRSRRIKAATTAFGYVSILTAVIALLIA